MKGISRISVLVDNNSWVLPHAEALIDWCSELKIKSTLVRDQENLNDGDVCFLLGCTQLVKPHNLNKHKLNLVVHESNLPQGKGFAPVAWQILEGKNSIPVCLIEATETADSGKIWLKDAIELDGTELSNEWRNMQGEVTVRLCKRFINEYKTLTPQAQSGDESFYARRRPLNSELDINKTLGEQFDLLRTVDNENYPAFFSIRGKKYKVCISELTDD